MELFPGYEITSSFESSAHSALYDYSPSIYEVLLGFGGVALTLAMTVVAIKNLRFLPESLADSEVDPHSK